MPELSMWTVYDHPLDNPETFVARRWDMLAGQMVATQHTLQSHALDDLRQQLLLKGLTRLHRSPDDDPKILETWL